MHRVAHEGRAGDVSVVLAAQRKGRELALIEGVGLGDHTTEAVIVGGTGRRNTGASRCRTARVGFVVGEVAMWAWVRAWIL